MGFGSIGARIGGIVAPFMISLQDYIEWLPNTIFGIFGKLFVAQSTFLFLRNVLVKKMHLVTLW